MWTLSQMYTKITPAGCWVPLHSLKAKFTACPEAESANGYQQDCLSAMQNFSVKTKNLVLSSLDTAALTLPSSAHSFQTMFAFPSLQGKPDLPVTLSIKASGLRTVQTPLRPVEATQVPQGWHQ